VGALNRVGERLLNSSANSTSSKGGTNQTVLSLNKAVTPVSSVGKVTSQKKRRKAKSTSKAPRGVSSTADQLKKHRTDKEVFTDILTQMGPSSEAVKEEDSSADRSIEMFLDDLTAHFGRNVVTKENLSPSSERVSSDAEGEIPLSSQR
jgi:hypothetical protein